MTETGSRTGASAAGSGPTGPILIIGTERSGSNLLRLMLNAHSRIAVPHPPHFMRFFAPIVASYGDLRVESNRRALANDMSTLLRRHIHPWPEVDADQVVARANPTLLGVVAAYYEQFRVAEDKARWGCKSTFMVDHVDDVLAEYPDARFVWLVREPRDVAASAKRSVFGHSHPYRMALLWRAQQERAEAALRRWGPEVVIRVRYEDLVTDPARELGRLCELVGEQVEPAMLRHHHSAAARQTGRLSESWRTAAQPVTEGRIGGHVAGLTRRERLAVDAVTADLKRALGYEVEPDAEHVSLPGRVEVALLGAVTRLRVEYRSALRDENHSRRWARDLTVRWLRLRSRMWLGKRAWSRTGGGLDAVTGHPLASAHSARSEEEVR